MENWQLTLTILASILTGALLPLLIMASIAVHKASNEIGRIGERLERTLMQVETISERVEVLSRGIKGESGIGGLLSAGGNPGGSQDRNTQIINAVSTVVASVVPLIAAFVKSRANVEKPENPSDHSEAGGDETGPPPA